jgi:biotin carboxylase
MACLLAEEFGVNFFSTDAVRKMENKVISRQIISQMPYAPRFAILCDDLYLPYVQDKIRMAFPFIMKYPRSAGSKDVYLINNEEEYEKCIKKIKRKDPDSPILVEEYLHGPQYIVEVITYKKVVYIVAVIKQQITYNKRFIITGYSLQLNLGNDFMESLQEAVESTIQSHNLENGACHLEMRLVENKWKLIECNPRISGGGMNKLLEYGLGINLVKETLKMTLGQEPNLAPVCRQHVFAQYIISAKAGILEKVTGRKRATQCPGVREIYVKPRKGALLSPPLSMGHRYAYVIASGDTEQAAEINAKHAASQINFELTQIDTVNEEAREPSKAFDE